MSQIASLPIVLGSDDARCRPEWRAAAADRRAPHPTRMRPSQFDRRPAGRGDQNLSERLDRSDGVIRPPSNVDPEMHRGAAGDRRQNAVIPAPGSPAVIRTCKPK